MSHNINEDKVMFVGERPWHGIGTELKKAATAEQAIEAAKLDYKIEAEPAFTKLKKEVENVKLIVRQDTKDVLGVVSDSYKIIQNVEAFSFFDDVVGGKQAIYHTAGALGKGERIWILAKLPKDTIITKDDVVEKYLLLANSHDGTSTLKMYYTPIRVVCQNTLILSLEDARDGVSIRHIGDMTSKKQEAQRILGLAVNYYARFSTDAHAIIKYQMSQRELEAYFIYALKGDTVIAKNESVRLKNERDELFTLFENGKGSKLPIVRGSLWAAYNSCAEYTDWHKGMRGLEADPTRKLRNIWFGGTGAQIKARAWQKALEVVGIKK